MSNIHTFIVAVNYCDELRISLPYNRHHWRHVTIVTSHADYPNVKPIAEANNAQVLSTDLFYADGGAFRKWLALEWALDQCGRKGWICLADADVLWPKEIDSYPVDPLCRFTTGINKQTDMVPGFLYTPLRRMYPTIPRTAQEIPPESEWSKYPIHRNVNEFAGYSQLYHADDPVLGNPPWHQVDWLHCGGADSFFQAKWPVERKIRPSWYCLHLGEAGQNWYGRSSAYADGSVPPDAQIRRDRVVRMWQERRGKRGMDQFRNERLL